jgi:sulfatase maturation enzyme AslB (radical SAM superfamily)
LLENYPQKKVQVEFQTNGFFSSNISDWIEQNVDILWISYDGMPKINDIQRPTNNGGKSSPLILKNIDRFKKVDRMQLGLRATIMEDNFYR